jgi:uncharacterized membrane protein YhaH (DUF805 family)
MSQLLFSYQGRVGIKGFWLGLFGALASTILLAIVVGVVIGLTLVLTKADTATQEAVTLAGAVLVTGYAIFTQLAVTVKRCHDRGRSGWWSLLSLVPFVGLVWLVFDLGVTSGKTSPEAKPTSGPV